MTKFRAMIIGWVGKVSVSLSKVLNVSRVHLQEVYDKILYKLDNTEDKFIYKNYTENKNKWFIDSYRMHSPESALEEFSNSLDYYETLTDEEFLNEMIERTEKYYATQDVTTRLNEGTVMIMMMEYNFQINLQELKGGNNEN